MVELGERFAALLKQEETFYKTEDYLAPEHQSWLLADNDSVAGSSSSSSSSSTGSSSFVSGINESWRNRIVEWKYQVCDHFDLSREMIAISMNILDRFLSKTHVDKQVFQLAAITCVHLASKLTMETGGNISMETMIELSRGYFTVDDMKRMELEILRYVCPEDIPYCQAI